jgi:uncharacterized protein DUF998
MAQTTATRGSVAATAPPEPLTWTTRALLTCGVVAAPLWFAVVLAQMLTRPGFDLRRHAISVLDLGDLGWVQVTNFVLAGLLMIACAAGLRRALHPGRAGTWGPLLVGAVGLGLIGGGLFLPDPMYGFPPGTPDVPGQVSGHGALHLVAASVAFLALIVATTVVLPRRLFATGQRGLAAFAIASGALFLVAWVALIVTAGRIAAVNLAFPVCLGLAWASIGVMAAGLVGGPGAAPTGRPARG